MSTASAADNRIEWLLALTAIPTAAGREERVCAWINAWVDAHDRIRMTRDEAGNRTLSIAAAAASDRRPIYFTAHLDHPAFVVDRIVAPGLVGAAFRGGVQAPYFNAARVRIHARDHDPLGATIREHEAGDPFRTAILELDDPEATGAVRIGDVATWDLPAPSIHGGRLRAPACDDLAAVAAALAALEELSRDESPPDARVLLTVAEEVGFVGAIAACKARTMPDDARVIALENSRAFAESPIGGGPIVRVGDRLSTFHPGLTSAIVDVAKKLAGEPDKPVGRAAPPTEPAFRWQRRLMPGGACEATAYAAYGYEAACVCLPLGAYHNMGDLERVLEQIKQGRDDIDAPIAAEEISVSDYEGLVDLLVACGRSLDEAPSLIDKLESLYESRRFVLEPD